MNGSEWLIDYYYFNNKSIEKSHEDWCEMMVNDVPFERVCKNIRNSHIKEVSIQIDLRKIIIKRKVN